MAIKSEERKKVRVAIIGVGNCASSLVQGVEYYRNNNSSQGLIHDRIGGYGAGDVDFVLGIDVDAIGDPERSAGSHRRSRANSTQCSGIASDEDASVDCRGATVGVRTAENLCAGVIFDDVTSAADDSGEVGSWITVDVWRSGEANGQCVGIEIHRRSGVHGIQGRDGLVCSQSKIAQASIHFDAGAAVGRWQRISDVGVHRGAVANEGWAFIGVGDVEGQRGGGIDDEIVVEEVVIVTADANGVDDDGAAAVEGEVLVCLDDATRER